MKVYIIEDETLAVERLRLLLQEYDRSIEICGEADSISTAIEWLGTHPSPDLIFLDIELADGKSFAIFNQVTVTCPVIFTTAYDHYALDAFKLFSIDYLLKPVTLQSLATSLKKFHNITNYKNSLPDFNALTEHLSNSSKEFKHRFLIKIGSRLLFIEAADVAYFYAEDKAVFLVTKEGMKYSIDYRLEKLETMLDPATFFRLSRKIICSVSAIGEIKTYFNNRLRILLHAGKTREEVIVSRERVNAFKTWAEL